MFRPVENIGDEVHRAKKGINEDAIGDGRGGGGTWAARLFCWACVSESGLAPEDAAVLSAQSKRFEANLVTGDKDAVRRNDWGGIT